MTIKCRVPNFKDTRYVYKNEDPNAPPDVVKKINWLHHKWEAATRMNPKHPYSFRQSQAQQKFWDRLHNIGNIVESGRFNPRVRQAVETRAIDRFGKVMDWIKRTSPEKKTKEAMLNFERRARGSIAEAVADLEVAKVAHQLHQTVKEFKKKYPKITQGELYSSMWDAIELGSHPYMLENTLQINEPALLILQKRKAQAMKRMEDLGLSVDDAQRLIEESKQLVQVNQELLQVGAKLGIDIAELEDLGYLPRIFTREAEQIKELVDNGGLFKKQNVVRLESPKDVNASFMKGRQYFDIIPEDVEVLDYLFNKNKVFDRLNERLAGDAGLRNALGKDKVNNLADIMDANENVINHVFINELDQDDFNALLELGFIHKVPWETDRVFKHMVTRYRMPFNEINDIFLSDPEIAMDLYVKKLQAMAGTRSKVWGTLHGALKDGWGVPKADVDANPGKYAEFTPLLNAYPESVLRKLDLENAPLSDHLYNTYVHKEVADTIKGDLTLVTNPVMMGMLGNTLTIMKKWASGMMLGTTQWLGRQVVGWGGTLVSKGINPVGYFTHFTKYAYARADALRKGINLDYAKYLNKNKTYFGGQFSQQELWRYAQKKGLVNDFNWLGEQGINTGGVSMKRTWRQIEWMRKEYPQYFAENFPQKVMDTAKRMTDEFALFSYLGWGNTITDNFGKFSFLEALGSMGKGINYGNLPTFKNIDDAIEYVYNRTWNFDDIEGIAKNPLLNTFVPFISWRMKNIEQTALFAIEHPHLFGSYLYLTGRPSNEMSEKRPEEWNVFVSNWFDKADFPLVWTIDADKSGTGKEEWFMFPATNFIPQLGAISDVVDIMETLDLFRSKKLPSERSDNPYRPRHTTLQRLVKEQTLPLVEAATAFYTGTDNWGRSFEEMRQNGKKKTLFGIEIDPVAHYFVTTIAPNIKQADRMFSFTGLGGESPSLNPLTGDWNEGEESWIGVTPDYPTTGQAPTSFGGKAENLFLNTFGYQPYHIDLLTQGGYKITDIEMQVAEGKKKMNSMRYKISTARNKEHAQKLVKQYENYVIWNYWLQVELGYFHTWRKKTGLPTKKALDAITQQNLNISDKLSDEEKLQIRKEIYNKFVNSNYFNP